MKSILVPTPPLVKLLAVLLGGAPVLALAQAVPANSGFGSTNSYSIVDTTRFGRPSAPTQPAARVFVPEREVPRKGPRPPARSSYPGPSQLEDAVSGGPRMPLRLPVQERPTLSFEGLPDSGFVPPDPDIAAGPEDLVMVVNSQVSRYTKTGSQTTGVSLTAWFLDLLPTICPGGALQCLIYDPTIHYDQLHGRFILLAVSLDGSGSRSHWLLSVSNGPSYFSGWKNWALDGTLNGTTKASIFIDFPKVGFDNSALYLTADCFDRANVYQYSKIRVLKKSEVYDQAATTLTYWDRWDLKNEDNSAASSIYPVRVRGRAGTDDASGYLVNASDNTDYLTLWKVVNPTGASPTINRTTVKGVWKYTAPARPPLVNSTVTMDLGDSRVLKAVLRNGYLYTGRNSGYTDQPTTVTYDRVDIANSKLISQTRWVNGNFFYPAFDVPASTAPSVNFPNLLPVGTNTKDGALTFLGITNVKDGEAIYNEDRWGDYFGASVDPVMGGMWIFGQYSRNLGFNRWSTWTAYFPINTTQQFSDVPSTHIFFDSVNLISFWKVTVGCDQEKGLYCPDETATRGQMAAFIIRAVYGENFTYPTTAYFKDVPATHPLFKYVQKMREQGITTGCAADQYCPDNPVTRGEAAVFIVRGKLKSLHGDAFRFPSTAYFTDVPSTHIFYRYIQKLRELGITTGCSDTAYCPDGPVTRGQVSRFLTRAFLN